MEPKNKKALEKFCEWVRAAYLSKKGGSVKLYQATWTRTEVW